MINIKIDSRKITQGDTFVALKGSNVDGHDFIEKAIENGLKELNTTMENVDIKDNAMTVVYFSNSSK